MLTKVFDAETSDGNSDSVELYGADGVIALSGTWDGATIHVEMTPDGGTTWIDLAGASYTTDGCRVFTLPARCQVRLVLSGAGAATVLNGWVG